MLSVLIPAYKNDETLLRMLESLSKQSIVDKIEIIISDDASIPPLGQGYAFQQFKNRLNIKWYCQAANLGVLGNARFLTGIATHKFVVLAQHDDYYIDNNFFERSIDLLINNPKLGFIFANAYFENSTEPFMKAHEGSEIFTGIIFPQKFWKPMNTSWSSLIFDNDLMKKFGGFGGGYTINEEQGHLFSAYPQEEGMGFLYLLATERDWVRDSCPVSVRGLPETRFSTSPNHPGRGLKNDVLTFVYWNISKLCEERGERGQVIAEQVRGVAATHFGLGMINSEVINFFGKSWHSLLFMGVALLMSRYQKVRHALRKSKHNSKHNLKLLLISLKVMK